MSNASSNYYDRHRLFVAFNEDVVSRDLFSPNPGEQRVKLKFNLTPEARYLVKLKLRNRRKNKLSRLARRKQRQHEKR